MTGVVRYGARGYAVHDEDLFMEDEYDCNSLQMMPPPQYSKPRHAAFDTGSHGYYADDAPWHDSGFQNGYYSRSTSPNEFSRTNAFNVHASRGKVPGTHYPGGYGRGRVQSNNMMMNSEFESYHAGARAGARMKTQSSCMCESYDDFANRMHGGRQQVEYKNL